MEVMERMSEKARGTPGTRDRAASTDGPVRGGVWAMSGGGP